MLAFLGEPALRALLLGVMGFIAAWILRGRSAEVRHAMWRIVLAANAKRAQLMQTRLVERFSMLLLQAPLIEATSFR